MVNMVPVNREGEHRMGVRAHETAGQRQPAAANLQQLEPSGSSPRRAPLIDHLCSLAVIAPSLCSVVAAVYGRSSLLLLLLLLLLLSVASLLLSAVLLLRPDDDHGDELRGRRGHGRRQPHVDW